MAKGRIPVVLVAGFLGSGKTTLLNHLLTNNQGARIGVVVNDFGSVNIDAMSVAGQVDSMVSLSNGCLCCAVDARGMDGLLVKLARPAAGIDVIVIEASGLAEPRELIRLLLASTNQRIEYGGLIEVVDAAEFESTRVRHPELDHHLAYADLVVLNKTDRLADVDRAELLATVEALSGGKPVVPAVQARIDPQLLFDERSRPVRETVARQLSFDQLEEDNDGHDHEHEHHAHSQYESVSFTSDQALHPRRLMSFLDDRPAGLYRMKGFVYFGLPGHRQKFTVHTVGSYLRITRSSWGRDEPRTTQLVLIGSGIDVDAVTKSLGACVEDKPDQVDPQSMLRVLRYTD
ncbi:MAG: yciC2 [Amycolatopsis sp.]|uniref:CobW family GTP-binding protein n=1 Tax=Amycolatopsis sp. TaxID=37632 RepID=UPI0026381406|nr:GTP-binding protein [Amycolatopsis sp.]MCU1680622.1 yciC2 [Amycolatopsis sp.]